MARTVIMDKLDALMLMTMMIMMIWMMMMIEGVREFGSIIA